ncbi:hypothetical protein [Campylobacter sp. MG1]|uniref:hypothetical protein n=1 Tax=Campylobacter sp. MG1 TaxID=2976332 RepID=UPI00226C8009|nr:hypothetical protein [Campylobacter sp. MG1]
MKNNKNFITILLFLMLASIEAFAQNTVAQDGLKTIWENVIGFLLNPIVIQMVFLALIFGGLMVMVKMGGMIGFLGLAVSIGIGIAYSKADSLAIAFANSLGSGALI